VVLLVALFGPQRVAVVLEAVKAMQGRHRRRAISSDGISIFDLSSDGNRKLLWDLEKHQAYPDNTIYKFEPK
jgi:hypothetical protein